MPRIIDADSHFMEPLDLWERYIDPKFRSRCLRFERNVDTGRYEMVINENKRIRGVGEFTLEQVFGVGVAYGQKEEGKGLGTFDFATAFNNKLEDMDERIKFLDREGFACQFIFPTLGLQWEAHVTDPELAAAHCRAYNTWASEVCATHRNRLFPVGHISFWNPPEAVRELERIAKAGMRTVFIGAMPIEGKSFGCPEYDPVWAKAQELEIAIGIHLVVHRNYSGHDWYMDRRPGFMYMSMNVIQDPRMVLTTMVYDGVFERFPHLRVATIESGSGWVVEWMDRLDYRYSYMGHSCAMKRPASEYFARNIWISADPTERLLPYMIELTSDDKYFIGSDFPHAEGFIDPIVNTRKALAKLPEASINKVLGDNAAKFFGV